MKKLAIRLSAVAFGVALAIAAIGPIQAYRFATALCDRSVDGVYEQVRYTDYTRDEVVEVMDFLTLFSPPCTEAKVVGGYIDDEGRLIIVAVTRDDYGSTFWFLRYAIGGQLESVQ